MASTIREAALTASGAYVWRAAIIAAAFNLLLNPGIAWVTSQDWDFITTIGIGGYVAVVSMLMTVLVSVLGARRVRREVSARHHRPSGGTAWERRLLARLPSTPVVFGAVIGLAATMVVLFVSTVAGAFGFSGFSLGTFTVVMAVYGGALAFLTMRWTILRQLMELVPTR